MHGQGGNFIQKTFIHDAKYQVGYSYIHTFVEPTAADVPWDSYGSNRLPTISFESNNLYNHFFMDFGFISNLVNLKKDKLNEYSVKAINTDRRASFAPLFAVGHSWVLSKFQSFFNNKYRIAMGVQYRYENSGMAFANEIANNEYPLLGRDTMGSGTYIKGNRSWYGINIKFIKTFIYDRFNIYAEYSPDHANSFRINPEIKLDGNTNLLYLKIGYRYAHFFGVDDARRTQNHKFDITEGIMKPVNTHQIYISAGINLYPGKPPRFGRR